MYIQYYTTLCKQNAWKAIQKSAAARKSKKSKRCLLEIENAAWYQTNAAWTPPPRYMVWAEVLFVCGWWLWHCRCLRWRSQKLNWQPGQCAWYGMVWSGMVWYGMVWYGMVCCGVVWCGVIWYGMVWSISCEGAPSAIGWWVSMDRHIFVSHAAVLRVGCSPDQH